MELIRIQLAQHTYISLPQF